VTKNRLLSGYDAAIPFLCSRIALFCFFLLIWCVMKHRSCFLPLFAVMLLAAGCPSKTPPATENAAKSVQSENEQEKPVENSIENDATKLSGEQSIALLKRFNAAIGALENATKKFVESNRLWDELAKDFPGDVSIAQNRAISKILRIKETSDSSGDKTAALKAASEAVATLKALAPDAIGTAIVESRLAAQEGDFDRQIEILRKATARNEKDAALWWDLYEACDTSRNPKAKDAGYQALQKAHALEPENLWIIKSLLDAAIARKDPALADYLAAAQQALAPVSDLMSERFRLDASKGQDVASIFQGALEAAQKDDLKSPAIIGIRGLRGILNLMTADDPLQSDQRDVKKNILEYLAESLSDPLKRRLTIPVELPAKSAVTLIEIAGPEGKLPVPGATDFAVGDFNLDDKFDLLVLAPESVEVFGRGAESWTSLFKAVIPAGYVRALVFDIDFDIAAPTADDAKPADATETLSPEKLREYALASYADLDVVLIGPAGLQAVRNELDPETKERKLVPYEAFAGVALKDVQTAAVFDEDMDGDLDLLVTAGDEAHLLINLGNGTFHQADKLLVGDMKESAFQSAVAVDFDRDIDLDVLVATKSGQLGMFENLRHGMLRWKSMPIPKPIQAVEVAELDGNVSWDILAAGDEALQIVRTRTVARGNTVPIETTEQVAVGKPGSMLSLDLDNNAAMDLLAWTDDGLQTWLNRGEGPLDAASVDARSSGGAVWKQSAVLDLDGDGDLDVAGLVGDELSFWKNETDPKSDFLNIGIVGIYKDKNEGSKRVNHYGLGSLLELRGADHYQAQVVRSQQTHFGLDSFSPPDLGRITWTNGIPQNIISPQPNLTINEPQTLTGSCPYLYTWDGTKFVFVTDLLWGAPLGMLDAHGQFVPSREWEYLLIPPGMLKAKDGRYVIQVTEELFEAGYFDEVELIAVDHPADVKVFTNEKVGSPEMATPKIHTVRNLKTPVRATDLNGRDILSEVDRLDDRFAQTFERLINQGYAATHGVEFDLGDVKEAKSIKLVLTGWMKPGDPNLSLALEQNPDLEGPSGPWIETPDGHGGWKTAVPFMGFPGGKTKTIVVDVSDVVNRDDARLRIASTMQLYWDRIGFTLDEPGEKVIEQPLPLISADLHYRGSSEAHGIGTNGPEWYDYDSVQTDRRWPSIGGRFTKYGDVVELVTKSDNKQAILGPGDEMTLAFGDPSQPIPDGWVRDFVLHNVGWDKDAQLGTILGQHVEPYPFLGVTQYPVLDGPEDTPEMEKYRREWLTREYSDVGSRRLLKTNADPKSLKW
jgi:hypothetical protein